MEVERLFYYADIPINTVNFFYFKLMLYVIFAIGYDKKGPSYHQLGVNILKDAKKEVQFLVNSYREIWKKLSVQ